MKIHGDSKLLQILIETPTTDEEIYEELSKLNVNVRNIERMYEIDLKFTNEELLKLIKDLSYIDNKHLNEMILYLKIEYPKDLSEKLDENLLKTYKELKYRHNIFVASLTFESLILCKYCYLNKSCEMNENEKANHAFVCFCASGHLECAKWIYNNKKDLLELDFEYISHFCYECYKHLNILKWFYEMNIGEYLETQSGCLLYPSAKNGNIEVVKWIFEILPKNNKDTINY